MKNIVANPESFRAELPLIENHPYFQTVTVTRDIDVELAARLADISLEDFKALNPSVNRPVVLAAGTPQILLPWDNAKIFERNFEAYSAGQYASWTAWSAPATMSVAEAARRVGMNESDLRSVNTIPPRMLIKAGSVLIVPRSAKVQNDVTSHVADNGQLNLAPEHVTRRTTVKAGKRDTRGQHRDPLPGRSRPGGRVERCRGLGRLQGGPAGGAVPAAEGAGTRHGAGPARKRAARNR